MNLDFKSTNVAFMCMAPSIVLSATGIPSKPVLAWIAGYFLALVAIGIVYQGIAVMAVKMRLSAGLRVVLLLLVQALFWWGLITFNR